VHGRGEPVKVTVNLSPVQLEIGDLVRATARALELSKLERLELEVTEGVLLHDAPRTHETLRKLRDLGVRIALDGFDAGFASLSYLHNFRFDKIKIDRSFVRELGVRDDSYAIVRAVPSSEVPKVLTLCRLKCIAVKPRTRIRTPHRPVRQRRAR
jgi:EAL domain-containing protein (putative c-di-GMP-specific phosphodiesterase class I)